jgi:hypothetical protein
MDIKPNINCLRNACNIKNNLSVIKLLVESGNLEPDYVCLKNIHNGNTNVAIHYIMNKFDKKYGTILNNENKN